ncbi:MAG: SLBB domain-containing protein [Coprothermobacterota bacterium]|nr:SLBB domain-containing protein [Coprothermobacterota bacterium]
MSDGGRSRNNVRGQAWPGGAWVHLHQEATLDKFIRRTSIPAHLYFPLLERSEGSLLRPLVRPGQSVKRGDLIAVPLDEGGLPLFSPVWGEVIALESRVVPWHAEPVDTLVIMPGKEELRLPSAPPKGRPTAEEIRAILAQYGVLNVERLRRESAGPRVLILNGCELEPYLTSTQRLLEERPKEIITGLELLLQAFEAERGILVTTTTREESITDLRDLLFTKDKLSLVVLPPRYPQDDPTLLRQTLLPLGESSLVLDLPLAVATTDAALHRKPMMEKVITVSGPAVRNPQNLEVHLGTLLSDLVSQCDGFLEKPGLIIMGGPMRGQVISGVEAPVTRYSTGFVFFHERAATRESSCMYCGLCINACPQSLYPVFISTAVKGHDWPVLSKLHADRCLYCGTCSYVCPAHISHQRFLRRALDRVRRR